MDVKEILEQARDALSVRRVFGDPIEREGVIVVPVANVRGGAGAGCGRGAGAVERTNLPAASRRSSCPAGSGSLHGRWLRMCFVGLLRPVYEADCVR